MGRKHLVDFRPVVLSAFPTKSPQVPIRRHKRSAVSGPVLEFRRKRRYEDEKPHGTSENVSQRARLVARGLNLFSPRVGTLVSSVTHYLKTSRRRGPHAGGRLRRSCNYCCADELTGSGRQ